MLRRQVPVIVALAVGLAVGIVYGAHLQARVSAASAPCAKAPQTRPVGTPTAGQRSAARPSELGDTANQAVLVVGLTEGSPAAAAGILVGDVLLAFDGHAIASSEDLMDALSRTGSGQAATLSVLRGGTVINVTVTTGDRPDRAH